MLTQAHVCGVARSILGQPWRWRGGAADDGDPGFRPDDLVDQLLLARGVARAELERHRRPTLRGFMPDPSVFQDMDKAAARIADAVEARMTTLSVVMQFLRRFTPSRSEPSVTPVAAKMTSPLARSWRS